MVKQTNEKVELHAEVAAARKRLFGRKHISGWKNKLHADASTLGYIPRTEGFRPWYKKDR